ncbi:benign gonial cell neoplasm protein isoform X2 [Drosophila novamexicana]|uniref:benign gonial cell neoplasm protein isoform X2 n=1 Tax=Drosophila novamexicana TaxID=47314 RepID=UPI0011E5B684|nr:benign gonial cell neoplasm protein isoform X2 [Drosophila novamexicana]
MEHTIRTKFIPQQLLYFIAGRRCCQQFACTFRTSEHNILINSAHTLGLRSQITLINGQECVKVFKPKCKHFIEEPKSLTLSPPTIIDMLTHLARTKAVGKDELPNCADYFGGHWSVKIPSLHIPLTALTQPTVRLKTEKRSKLLRNGSLYSQHDDILGSIYGHRVTMFDGNLCLDKSILVPLLILEDSESKNINIKVICIEKDNILATYNCERFAECLAENIGETVGIQVPQHNIISSATQVVYTTAKAFMRSLFNKNSKKFSQISHFVINDVHLHDPYTDILLYELKQALNMDRNLRIILLSQECDSMRFVNFFGEGTKFCMEPLSQISPNICYLEDIRRLIALTDIQKGPEIYKKQRQVFRNKNQRNEQIDKCLQAYEEIGSDVAIRPFLYSINYESVPVNYQHSVTGKTAILIASQLGKANHLRLLLFMGANPYISDAQHENAITVAALNGNAECIDILENFELHGYVVKDAKPEFVDFDLIIDLMYLICTKSDFSPGNILIVLPTFYHIVKLNYMLLGHLLTGNLPEFSIFLLHENMDKEYLCSLVKSRKENKKVVLTTDIIESLPLPVSFQYLIDTACQKRTLYDGISISSEDRYEWVAKDCLLRRQSILDAEAVSEKHCFRLISKDAFQMLSGTSKPLLQTMHLDKICLTVKLLSPNTIISEYLSLTISPPPLINVHQTVQFLKKIDVLDESEDVTWLGCRLIDIPVPCQLGRTLIFGILLQCLDPILTVVSSLITSDPLSIPSNEEIDCMWDGFTIYIQNRIKNERARLAEDQFSDHLIFVRLFQEWQSRFKNDKQPLYLTDDYEFMLNGLMEQLNLTRIRLVSALRAANLIHSQGQLSIQNLNTKSGSWPLIKAALTGGMYPNICAVNDKQIYLNSAQSSKVHLHSNTVLRDFLEPFQISAQRICTHWMVCTKQKNNVKYATVVVPLAVAMFAGSTKLGLGQITEIQSPSDKSKIHFFIDEWIWLVAAKSDIELVLKTRQQFFKVYHKFLKNCTELEKWRSESTNSRQHLLLETLTTIFTNEDAAAGLKECSYIGFRPTLKLPALYMLSVNSHFTWQQTETDLTNRTPGFESILQHTEKHYFLLYTEHNPGQFYKKSDASYIESVIGKFARPIESPSRHIYVILYSKKPDRIISIGRAKSQKGEFILKEYFRNAIPLSEILPVHL